MPLFKYRAVDSQGEPDEGTIEEKTAVRVSAMLSERGLQVSSIERVAKPIGFQSLKRPLSWQDVEVMSDHLAMVARSGLPMAPALRDLARDVRSPRLKAIADEIRGDLESGSTLEDAFEKRPDAFPPMYTSVIRAGERSGNLSGVLSMLQSYSSRMLDLQAGIRFAMVYPVFILGVTIALTMFLLIKVMPVFADIFSDLGGALPAPTKFWLEISDFIAAHGVGLFVVTPLVALALVLGYRLLTRTDAIDYWIDRARDFIPVLGGTHKLAATARFSRTLGLLLSSGVPIIESLDLAAAAAGHAVMRRKVNRAVVMVNSGMTVSQALGDTGYFPHLFSWLLRTGEERGEVPEALLDTADTYEREVMRRDKSFVLLIEPVMIVFVAMLVGSIVVSLYLPIFTLGDQINK